MIGNVCIASCNKFDYKSSDRDPQSEIEKERAMRKSIVLACLPLGVFWGAWLPHGKWSGFGLSTRKKTGYFTTNFYLEFAIPGTFPGK